MRTMSMLLVVLGSLACHAPPPLEAPLRSIEPTPSTTTAASATIVQAPPKLGIDAVACAFDVDGWHQSGQSAELALSANGGRWATLSDDLEVPARLEIEVGSMLAMIHFVHEVVAIRSWLGGELPKLRAQQPIAMSGFAYPHPHELLSITSASAGTLGVELALGRSFIGTTTVQRSAACSELGLPRGDFDLADALVGDGDAETLHLVRGRDIPVRVTPEGRPATIMHLPVGSTHPWTVHVLERKQGHAKIAWPSPHAWIVGWVDASALEDTHTAGGLGLSGIGGGGYGRAPTPLGVRCSDDVALYARVREQTEAVGVIRKGALIVPGADDDELRIIDLHDFPLTLAQGAVLLAPAAELRRCTAS